MINILKVTLEFTTTECFGDELNGLLWLARYVFYSTISDILSL